jgi:septal ring factor EnvC (AmiA/AmiB activator)
MSVWEGLALLLTAEPVLYPPQACERESLLYNPGCFSLRTPGSQAQATILVSVYVATLRHGCHYGMPHISPCALPSQLNYADMLKRVEPLRNELQKLEDDAKDNQQKANEVEQMIRDLEASIARYKEEYAVLISEAQAIKADLAAVEAKVSLPATP